MGGLDIVHSKILLRSRYVIGSCDSAEYPMRSSTSSASVVVIIAEGAKAEDLLITPAKSNIFVVNFPHCSGMFYLIHYAILNY